MFGGDYEDNFDPCAYLNAYYASAYGDPDEEGDFKPTVLTFLHHEFQRPCHQTGGSLLDFGSGPSIYSVISASRLYNEITLSDYTQVNRQQLQKWLSSENDAHNWNPIISHIATLESNRDEVLESRIRRCIIGIISCDATKSNPISNNPTQLYDCITSSLCLETCSKTLEEYNMVIQNVASLLKPGGILILVGVLGETFYTVKNVQFFALKLRGSDVTHALANAGFEDIQFEKRSFSDPSKRKEETAVVKSNFEGYFMLHATKKPDRD